MVRVSGVMVRPKSLATVMDAVASWAAPETDEVPVTVKVAGTPGAPAAAVRVRMAFWPAWTVAGEKTPVTPVGRPETARVSCCEPPVAVVVTVYVTLLPEVTDWLAGVTEMPKSSATVMDALAVREREPALPVT